MAEVVLRGVTKRWPDGSEAVRELDLEVADGEFVILVGPSGCGKSTTLRMVAGLEDVSEGQVLIGGRDVTAAPPGERGIAMVFQSYALYPHLTVRENLGYALRIAKVEAAERSRRVDEAAEMLGIADLLDRLPATLSGGQQQRVAMGRAIVRDPAVFLMDEPLSNLDAKLRTQVRSEIAALQRRLGATTLYVTHDQTEAMTMGDRVAVLHEGRLRQIAPPAELYEAPADVFVAEFIGSPAMNLLDATLGSDGIGVGGVTLTVPPALRKRYPRAAAVTGQLVLGLRPEDLSLGPSGTGLDGAVELVEHLGSETLVHVAAASGPITVRTTARRTPKAGDRVGLVPDLTRAHLFDPADGAALR